SLPAPSALGVRPHARSFQSRQLAAVAAPTRIPDAEQTLRIPPQACDRRADLALAGFDVGRLRNPVWDTTDRDRSLIAHARRVGVRHLLTGAAERRSREGNAPTCPAQ